MGETREGARRADHSAGPFSPLFVGSMGETLAARNIRTLSAILSVPFSSGRWVKLAEECVSVFKPLSSFSPLFVGSMGETVQEAVETDTVC